MLVVGIILRGLLAGVPALLGMAEQSSDVLDARRAAEAGAAYARLRLREDPDWKASGQAITVSRPDMVVVESKGNVYGLLTDLHGKKSLFRIRFNDQDGPGGSDGLDDPPALMNFPYLSVNNLKGSGDVSLYRATNQSPWSPTGNPVLQVAPGNVALLVDGRTGSGIQGMQSPTDTPGTPTFARTLQVTLGVALDTGISDAGIMAGGDLTTVGGGLTGSVVGWGTPRLRSKGGVRVLNELAAPADLRMEGEVGRDKTRGMVANVVGSVDERNEEVGDTKDFYSLKWADVHQADGSVAGSAVQLPGGVYVFDSSNRLFYYDTTFADYKSGNRGPGVEITSDNLREVRAAGNLDKAGLTRNRNRLEITADLAVIASGNGIKDLVITPAEGHPLGPGDTTMSLAPGGPDPFPYSGRPTVEIVGSTLSVPGDAKLLCDVDSQKSVLTVEGDAVVAATSVIFNQVIKNKVVSYTRQPTQKQGLSLYVKGDLTLSSYQPAPANYSGDLAGVQFSGFGDLKLEGLVYCWGDVKTLVGGPGISSGNLTVRGALVAYGADPESGQPGSAGNGKVELHAGLVDLTFDAALVANGLGNSIPTTLRRSSYDFNP